MARRTEIRQLRAYVKVEPKDTPNYNTATSFDVAAVFRNVGQTPAVNAHGFVVAKTLPWPIPPDYPFEPKELSPPITEMPTIDHQLNVTADPATPEEEDSLITTKGALVVYGTVFFADVFGYGRWTDFCYAYTWQSLAEKRVIYCSTHNGADTD